MEHNAIEVVSGKCYHCNQKINKETTYTYFIREDIVIECCYNCYISFCCEKNKDNENIQPDDTKHLIPVHI